METWFCKLSGDLEIDSLLPGIAVLSSFFCLLYEKNKNETLLRGSSSAWRLAASLLCCIWGLGHRCCWSLLLFRLGLFRIHGAGSRAQFWQHSSESAFCRCSACIVAVNSVVQPSLPGGIGKSRRTFLGLDVGIVMTSVIQGISVWCPWLVQRREEQPQTLCFSHMVPALSPTGSAPWSVLVLPSGPASVVHWPSLFQLVHLSTQSVPGISSSSRAVLKPKTSLPTLYLVVTLTLWYAG